MRCVTNDEILGIVLLDAFDESHSQIAKKFEIGKGTVNNILYMRAFGKPRVGMEGISSRNKRGGLSQHGSNAKLEAQDLEEVRDYLARFPEASVHDVALECNFGDAQASRLMRLVEGERMQGEISIYSHKYITFHDR